MCFKYSRVFEGLACKFGLKIEVRVVQTIISQRKTEYEENHFYELKLYINLKQFQQLTPSANLSYWNPQSSVVITIFSDGK